MKNKVLKSVFFIATLFIGIIIGIFLRHNSESWTVIKKLYSTPQENNKWSNEFKIANITSSLDSTIQKSYYYRSKSKTPKPLVVSLHTWSGNYSQFDKLSELCRNKDLNYIHPNFRGQNNSMNACCSHLALSDIDDAISYAINNFNVDTNEIYVIGFSGGGYATLATFMKSKHNIKKFSAWASITDLVAWYKESQFLENSEYVNDILKCTGSNNKLNIKVAKEKSPIYWNTPTEKLSQQKLQIYAGIYDGLQGSVPITHSINFYNKVLEDLSVKDSTKYVSAKDKLALLENREPIGKFGSIADRQVFLRKQYNNLSLEIFEGEHEILLKYALENLLNSK
jgi:esterase/lipase